MSGMEQPSIVVHEVSLSTAMVIAMCDDQEISRSTGFLWSHAGKQFLITNWHSITGVNPNTGAYLSKRYAARPNKISVALVTTRIGQKLGYEIELFDKDGNPRWLVHPTAGEQVDIIAICLPDERETPEITGRLAAVPMNELRWVRLQRLVGDELFIVGFPHNLHMHGLPIWKRATFATEPSLFADQPGRREVWVDSASRRGMSGSPVIQVARAHFLRPRTDQEFDGLMSGYCFFGIYSGRLVDPDQEPWLDDQFSAQLGIVWPRELIEEVVAKGVRDKFRREDAFERTREVGDGGVEAQG